MENKVYKYAAKLDNNPRKIYVDKIIHYLSTHGLNNCDKYNSKNCQIGGMRDGNVEDILEFLKIKSGQIKEKTKNKYLVILYGPPSSGKSIARKIACHYIKEIFGENDKKTEDIFNTFMDSGVDEIAYDFIINDNNNYQNYQNRTIGEQLKKNLGKEINDILINEKLRELPDNNNKEELIKKHIARIVQSSYKIYSSARTPANKVSDLLRYFALFLGNNIFFEIATPDPKYIGSMIDNFGYYGYIPLFIYPFVKNVNVLYERSISRGLDEGRFINCGGNFGLANSLKNCFEKYGETKKQIYEVSKKEGKDFLIFMYDADFPGNIYKQIKDYNFENIEKYAIEYEYMAKKENYVVSNSFKIMDYPTIKNLDLECK